MNLPPVSLRPIIHARLTASPKVAGTEPHASAARRCACGARPPSGKPSSLTMKALKKRITTPKTNAASMRAAKVGQSAGPVSHPLSIASLVRLRGTPIPPRSSTLSHAFLDVTQSIVSPGLNQIESHGDRGRLCSGGTLPVGEASETAVIVPLNSPPAAPARLYLSPRRSPPAGRRRAPGQALREMRSRSPRECRARPCPRRCGQNLSC
jgi:hypothetical protein